MIKIIHLISDEKFIDDAISQFSSLTFAENVYLLRYPFKGDFSHIKYKQYITFFSTRYKIYHFLKTTKYDTIIYHGMYFDPLLFLCLSKESKIGWISWGADLYADVHNKLKKYYPIELELYKKRTALYIKHRSSIDFIKCIKDFVFYRFFIKKIDFMSTVLPIEKNLIKRKYNFSPFYFDYRNIWQINSMSDSISIKKKLGNIMIGNSATATNNHLDVFYLLSKYKLAGRKVIVPLSYGDDLYRNEIIRIGFLLFKNNFMPLVNFLEKDDYVKIIESCSHVMMGHIRQQALGNIEYALQNGSKLYLFSSSLLYKSFVDEGFAITPLEEVTQDSLDKPLDVQDALTNYKKIKLFGDNESYFRMFEKSLYKLLK